MQSRISRITFDSASLDFVLGIFHKKLDAEGYIAEEDGTRVVTPDSEEIRGSELGVIQKGSLKFIPNDVVSLLRFSKGQL